jgi:hypothetical protein
MFQEFEEVIDDEGSTPVSDSPTASTDSGGPIGIGLAVVARYVRNMKGQIRVHSEPGKGTIFGIELPFEHAKETADEAAARNFSFAIPFPRAMSDTSSTGSTIITQKEFIRGDSQRTIIPAHDTVPSPSTSGTEPSVVATPQDQSSPIITEPPSSRYPFPRMVDIVPTSSEREILSVLIAEDNPINSRLLTRRLEKLGHRVHLTQDGQECHDYFKTAESQKIDVILMDIQVTFRCGNAQNAG